ncbi:MAG: L-rhamnose isomerase [Planctomycetota bacterium]
MRALSWKAFETRQGDRGIRLPPLLKTLDDLAIETPSWGYGDGGTRFKVFHSPGAARNVFEKFEDAAVVHALTGLCPSVAVHIPWDKATPMTKLRRHAAALGLRIGAVNPNLFQDDAYKFGSVTSVRADVRRKAIRHLIECVDIAREVRSEIVSLWFADGTNYPGQGDIRARKEWMEEALAATARALGPRMRMLIEYKFFEPAFYHTDIADWGMAFTFASRLGPKAQVLVDTGHHAPGTNVEHVVAFLLDEEKLGGFHFNSRKYADDDLIVGSHNPYELFLIFHEILQACRAGRPGVRRTAGNIAFMIDQSHAIEPKIPAMIRSVLNVQTGYAKALLVNPETLREARAKDDVLGAESAVREAFEQDVTPLLAAWRERRGLPADPLATFAKSGLADKLARERG